MPPLICVIDDDPETVSLLREVLEGAGYRTVSAVDHDLAAELAHREQPDLLILDLMQGSAHPGWVSLTLIRSNPVTAAIPVLMLSGNTAFLDEQRELLAARGCVPLAKPFTVDALV